MTSRLGDGSNGWPEQAPFPRIIVTAAAEDPPEALLKQLSVGGIMVLPIGSTRSDQDLVRIRRTDSGFELKDILPVRFVPMVSGVAGDG